MSYIQAILLGLVQGITEFLPVSSSGHLTLFAGVFHLHIEQQLFFEVLVHLGTLVAVMIAFRMDFLHMFREVICMCRDIRNNFHILIYNKLHENHEKSYKKILYNNYRKLVVMLILSTIPTAVIGFLLRNLLEAISSSLLAAGLGLLVTGLLLFVVDYWKYGEKIPKNINPKDAVLIGICQGLGCFPGISRSGITITAALFMGFQRSFAVRYSFLLSVPAILGAMLLELTQISLKSLTVSMVVSYLLAAVAAGISGYFCIRLMLKLVKKKRFRYFAAYCFVVGCVALICHFTIA